MRAFVHVCVCVLEREQCLELVTYEGICACVCVCVCVCVC